jgi:hypothetical protein
MKAAVDIATELGNALDELAAMHALVSMRLQAQRGLSPDEMHSLIHSSNDAVVSLKRVLAIAAATGGGPQPQ